MDTKLINGYLVETRKSGLVHLVYLNGECRLEGRHVKVDGSKVYRVSGEGAGARRHATLWGAITEVVNAMPHGGRYLAPMSDDDMEAFAGVESDCPLLGCLGEWAIVVDGPRIQLITNEGEMAWCQDVATETLAVLVGNALVKELGDLPYVPTDFEERNSEQNAVCVKLAALGFEQII